MFKFEIITKETRYNSETQKCEPITFTGKACGNIEDHLARAGRSKGYFIMGEYVIDPYQLLAIHFEEVAE